jgi:outer membrane protein OmpA-like peptidoglycan-associated protein
MKKQNLFAIGFGTLLVALTGCKSPERFTNLGPAGSSALGAGSGSKTLDLSAAPIDLNGQQAGGTDVVGVDAYGLADDSDLANRDMDRSVFAADTVYFGYDLASVKADEATKVARVMEALKARGSGYDLLVEGHADERGTEEYNRALGERRALAIRELLTKSGLEGTRVFTRTFGKDQPAVASHDEAAWSKNRRGEFVLVLPKKLITTQNTK